MRAWSRVDTVALGLLAGAALATRILARSTAFVSIDAGLLALGIVDYDFAAYQPHPPYYPLVIALGKLLALWLTPLAALTWLSIAASGLLVAGTFLVARRLGGRGVALLASLLVVLSPVALRNGALPLSYALEGAASVAVALAALRCRDVSPRARDAWLRPIVLGVAVSIAVGLRPSSLVLLAPLALWALWGRWRELARGMAAGALATAAWLVPTVVAGGGWHEFRVGLQYQSRAFVLADPVWVGGWPGVAQRAAWLADHARHELPFLTVLVVLCLVAAVGLRRPWRRGGGAMLAAWLVPSAAFYLLVYAGWPVYPDGYLLAVVPGVAILAALAVRALATAVTADGVPVAAQVVGVAVVLGVAVLPCAWIAQWDGAMAEARAAEAWSASYDGLEEAFLPNETALVMFYDAPWVAFEHPGYLVWSIQVYRGPDGLLHSQVQETGGAHPTKGFFTNQGDGIADAPHPVPPWVKRIAVIDGHPLQPPAPTLWGVPLSTTMLAGGHNVTWTLAAGLTDIESALWAIAAGPLPYEPRLEPPRR